jgi:hypothetical protein
MITDQTALRSGRVDVLTRHQFLRLAAGAAAAQSSPEWRTGPEPGQRIPLFSLPDQFGKLRDFQSLCGDKGLVLAFVRSADW